MKLKVLVKIKSKKEGVEEISADNYIVRVNAVPEGGNANKRVIELLAKFLGVAKTRVKLERGAKSKIKLFNVVD